jgi:hypothetical protein
MKIYIVYEPYEVCPIKAFQKEEDAKKYIEVAIKKCILARNFEINEMEVE